MYATGSICSPYYFAATMLCRLFGKPDINKFLLERLPLVNVAINATIMNWVQILSDNLATAILEYRRKGSIASRVYPPFFFSSYVMDAICFFLNFLLWDGSGWYKIHFPFRFITNSCRDQVLCYISLKFVTKLYSQFIKRSTIDMPQGFPKKLRWIFSLWQDGLGKKFSLTSKCLVALLHPMCYLITSQTN